MSPMSTKTDRLAEMILSLSSPIILEHLREHGEQFGIASVTGVEVTKDRSYADIYVSTTSTDETINLPKFLSVLADEIRREVGKKIQTYKIPQIRFKRTKNQTAVNSVHDIINELSRQYDLHE